MKRMRKLSAVVLAAVMVLSACGSNPSTGTSGSGTNPNPANVTPREIDSRPAKEVMGNKYKPTDWYAESQQLYEAYLGDFLKAYAKVKDAKNLSERYALQAVAEATLYGSALFIPTTTRGGNYALSRVVPKSVNSTLWGSNTYRYHTALVTNELLKHEDYDHVRGMWSNLTSPGTYVSEAKKYLSGKGYTFKDSYSRGYTTDPDHWDTLASSKSIVSEPTAMTVDGLYVYNEENKQVPAIALSHTVSEDGLTYTFKLRNDVKWVDSQGREIGGLTADDFVAGLQHLLDSESGPRGLLVGVIKGAKDYVGGVTNDIADVGVKAVDDYTLEYTLEKETPYFLSMLAYNIFLPMSRSYYISQGGKFGAEYDAANNGEYGKDPDHIAYCGPMIVTNWTKENIIVYKANKAYYNPSALLVHEVSLKYNPDTDKLKAYRDVMSGVLDVAGLSEEALKTCKAEDKFNAYAVVNDTTATTFCGWLNVNRKIYTNFNSNEVASNKNVTQAEDSIVAMQNVHFRRALIAGFDKASYNAQSVGEELKLNALRNSYTPATYVSLEEDVTVDIDGTATNFKAGTKYGQIVQAVLDARKIPITVWNVQLGTGDGFDGWYNPEYCKSELAIAVNELAAQGILVDKDHPIIIDYPYPGYSTTGEKRAQAVKQSIEKASDGLIQIDLIKCNKEDDYHYSGYNTTYGYERNSDLDLSSGWGPDYGDPQTYLSTLVLDEDGYMLANLGMFGQ